MCCNPTDCRRCYCSTTTTISGETAKFGYKSAQFPIAEAFTIRTHRFVSKQSNLNKLTLETPPYCWSKLTIISK
ncbi:hypothetical protein BGI32_04230 [Snodgrassella alvi]|uniref:Uncharacterized protein n=1 Tax=Snodgrassella alvi TaxID=1196083 RepID=A0A2N9WUW8_9NEIS|nr:hypothetical protein BGI32_04230 [Snodgrassella alvi]